MERKTLIDHKSSIYLFVLLFVVYALIYMTKNCYSAAMASIVADGVMTKSQTGLISAVFYLVYAVFQVVGGVVSDKFSPYKIMVIGFVGAAIANTLICFVEGYTSMLIIWAFNAVVQFGVWPSIFRIITTQLAPDYRVNCMYYILFSSNVGLLFSYIVAMFVKDWKHNFLISAIVLYICAAVFYFGYRKIEKKMVVVKTEERVVKKSKTKSGVNIWKLILISGAPMIMIVYCINSMLSLGLKSLAPVMLMESYDGISASTANGLNIVLVIATPVGLVLSRAPFLKKLSPPMGMAVMFLLAVPLLFVITLIGKVSVFVILAMLTILTLIMAPMPMFSSFVSLAFEKYDSVATLSGIINAMASLGIVIANYVFVRIADFAGWEVTIMCWLILAVSAAVMGFVAVPIWKRFIKR